MTSSILKQSIDSYRFAGLFFCFAFPLALIPVLGEAFQHIIEVQLGMFTSGDEIAGATETNKRLAAALVKVMAMFSTVLLLPRYFLNGRTMSGAFGRPRRRSTAFSPVADVVPRVRRATERQHFTGGRVTRLTGLPTPFTTSAQPSESTHRDSGKEIAS